MAAQNIERHLIGRHGFETVDPGDETFASLHDAVHAFESDSAQDGLFDVDDLHDVNDLN